MNCPLLLVLDSSFPLLSVPIPKEHSLFHYESFCRRCPLPQFKTYLRNSSQSSSLAFCFPVPIDRTTNSSTIPYSASPSITNIANPMLSPNCTA
ncbi:hypothetical protein ERO13_D11G202620v2 [Gossypium hirsutum]|uniref:Uncharacterized protein n=4 Tax=Gossypium TaxID=3633 RepID=A0A5J5PF67_GOSBA|nr:hypothetical protein ES319_D11G215000v1 [Gossypium barbadense]KAG4121370.1 hypothetical protein ERO13_D11G202620v2 [Gossypium hirsutum]TYG46070.1 hypothetical protein ES288_D11G226800v1 [Gossypium darwinii]TYH44887.1 hypothetical protein ES332_D11G225600v1 [Gossypium tomentosum]TYI56585.1 hypothetical protein E1A91_D11G221100v1 [Gossypium mustelinum]